MCEGIGILHMLSYAVPVFVKVIYEINFTATKEIDPYLDIHHITCMKLLAMFVLSIKLSFSFLLELQKIYYWCYAKDLVGLTNFFDKTIAT